jgi:hypothetical protein
MHAIARLVLLCVALSFALAAHAERDISGTTASGAYYQIAVPDSWKAGDSLILFQHGLSFDPPAPNPDLGPLKNLQLSEGYAIAASSFRQRSWALFSAPDDNVVGVSACGRFARLGYRDRPALGLRCDLPRCRRFTGRQTAVSVGL